MCSGKRSVYRRSMAPRISNVEAPPMLVQEPVVDDLVRQRVLEAVLELGEEADRVDELGGHEPVDDALELLLGLVGDRLKERKRHGVADDRTDLQDRFLGGAEAIDPSGQDRLHGRWNGNRRKGLDQTIGLPFPREDVGLHEVPDGLFDEERVAIRQPDQDALERPQVLAIAEQGASTTPRRWRETEGRSTAAGSGRSRSTRPDDRGDSSRATGFWRRGAVRSVPR